MSHRAWWLVIAALVLLGVAVALQDGLRVQTATAEADLVPVAQTSARIGEDRDASPDIDRATRLAQADAMREAVETLHRYFPVLFREDTAEADAFWLHGRPAAQGEADLRALEHVSGLRVDNAPPEALSAGPAPDSVRVPVRLRIGGQGPLRRYTGHYDLRRDADGWRIAAASIARSPEPG